MPQTTIWDIRKLLTLDTVKMGQLAVPAFLGQFEEPVVTRARSKSDHKTGPLCR
jgi:hypothetical protein